jgi:hypothetical protein
MPARVPLDVDLEDRLLYGLTPTRLAYLVISLIAAFALWSSSWAATPVRAGTALVVVGAGAAIAWGRWRGRPADALLVDIAMFIARTHRISINRRLLRIERRHRA